MLDNLEELNIASNALTYLPPLWEENWGPFVRDEDTGAYIKSSDTSKVNVKLAGNSFHS